MLIDTQRWQPFVLRCTISPQQPAPHHKFYLRKNFYTFTFSGHLYFTDHAGVLKIIYLSRSVRKFFTQRCKDLSAGRSLRDMNYSG
jgi:hypothetical protein